MIQITAPHFCAAVVMEGDKVIRCAPIVSYMKGWNTNALVTYCRHKGWQCEVGRAFRPPAPDRLSTRW